MGERAFRKGIPRKLNEEKIIKIFELASSVSVKAIAAIMDVNDETIRRILRGTIWRHVENNSLERYKGTTIKITDQQVLLIRALHTKTNAWYAAKLNISPCHYSKIKNGRSRKKVHTECEYNDRRYEVDG